MVHRAAHRDARRADRTNDARDLGAGRAVGSQTKGPGIAVSVCAQEDFLEDPSRSGWIANSTRRVLGIVTQSKVIEQVAGLSNLFPHSQAEVAILRRSSRVHNFRSIVMPLDNGIVDRRAVRRTRRITFGREVYMPHPYNRVCCRGLGGKQE